MGIPTSQLVLHLTKGLADNSPNIVVNEAHKQVPETSLLQLQKFQDLVLIESSTIAKPNVL